MALCFGVILAITYQFEDYEGKYAAFGQNFMMSVLFIMMLRRRGDVSGQSIYIALLKLVGTGAASILFFSLYPGSALLNCLYLGILIFDVLYVVLLLRKHRDLSIRAWRRC